MHLNDLKKLKRFKDIVAILAKYGFDEVVDRFDLPGSDFLHNIAPVDDDLDFPERIRIMAEELGPTFVKFGQIMSIRPDLLPPELLRELEKLQDSVPPVDSAEILPVIEQSLGQSIDEIFIAFDKEPVAAASLSQVYRGVLREDDVAVALKVQRPDIGDDIISDLDILESICTFLDQKFEELRCYDLPELVQTIRHTLIDELDFRKELTNTLIASSHAEDTDVTIPKVLEKYSSDKVLVIEFFDGENLRGLQSESLANREMIAKKGLQTVVQQILVDGFFHADPHPGNLLVDKDLNLGIIDWGMVGRLTEEDRFTLIELLSAVVDKNSQALTRIFLKLCEAKGETVRRNTLERELINILDGYHALAIKDMDIGSLIMDLLSLLRKHQMRLPPDMIIMVRALVTAEGSARLIYPDLNIVEELRGSVQRLTTERFKPGVVWKNFKNSLSAFLQFKNDLPQQIMQIIEKAESGGLSFNLHLNKLEQLVKTIENASNRLTTGIITGAIIMGSSMIITTGVGPFLFGLPALGVIGYLLSVVLGLWIVFNILRGNNSDT